ncbi:ZIP family metal transporter [Tenacibaculum holothuriorum]|uniref:ZIP family metal transporter n=1 Tax=Tenacibaculum holothuriorum TaxID=1635173 RepID=A0A1Y2PIB6_9FLAO|nr:ZIP family metal transporter [Tenacibaculum holothuriorum]OSY89547.1 ZIP family metal transporter [Tenacibaculum holothuriorum]
MSYLLLIASVLIGAIIVLLLKPSNKIVRLLLAFSGAYLLSVTVLHLIPEVYEHAHGNTKRFGILILAGILIQSVLESFSKGAEHGHIHIHSDEKKFFWLLFFSLCLHAFSEGLPINHDHSEQDNLLWAIVIHKIPIAIVLTTFLQQAKYPKKTVALFLTVFALMTPLGKLLAEKVDLFIKYHTEITALIIGVFLHISTVILFESSENHKFNLQKFSAILLGILLTIFSL